MMKVVCTIFAIVIEDLELYLGNLNFLLEKNRMWFELLDQRRETGMQKSDTPYYKYKKSIS